MLDRPAIDDAAILAGLRDRFGLAVDRLSFTPLGNDSAAWTYRAGTSAGDAYFVKVRRRPRPAGVLVPQLLHDRGMAEVVAALTTRDGEPWLDVDGWCLLVYPLVDAPSAMHVGLDDDGWRRLGAFAALLHATTLPAELASMVPREDFRPKANDLARRVAAYVAAVPAGGGDLDEMGRGVVDAWRRHASVIERLVDRSDALGRQIRERQAGAGASRFVTCHADLHANNVLVLADGGIAVIDWDEVMLAPPERDLMFVRGSAVAGVVTDDQATAFEAGYGGRDADPLLIAWYRIDWAVQDLADFARRVLLDVDAGDATRAHALELFQSVFEPGGEADTAIAADDALA